MQSSEPLSQSLRDRRARNGFSQTIQTPRARFLITVAGVLLAIKFALAGLLFSSLLVLIGLGYLFPLQIIQLGLNFEQFCKARRWNTAIAVAILGCGVLSAVALFGGVEPASAQFFNKTEQWMNTALGSTVDTNLTKLTFNVLRLVFVLYLGIALVKVVSAARDGDDWQTLARTPGIILITVTMGDVLGALITGAK